MQFEDLIDSADDPDRLAAVIGALDNPGLTSLYLSARREYRDQVARAERLSRASGGISSTGNRMYWGAVLFTRIGVTAKSVEILLPDCRAGQHWDFSATASITRNLMEACLVHRWLCGDGVDDIEREARFILFHLHDHGSRRRLLSAPTGMDDPILDDLTRRFDANAFLAGFDASRRKVALRGERTPFVQDDVLDGMGLDRAEFRLVYRLFSQHTHTGPISFYDALQNERGVGVETRKEKFYMFTAIGFAHRMLEAAIDTHMSIFPDAHARAPHVTRRQSEINVEREQGRRPRRR